MNPILLQLRDVEKDYRGLRPLRIRALDVRHGESVALLGFDQITAELFVNLVTGAVTPDAGVVRAFGQSTSEITDADAWLASLDRFGILSERAVLLDQLTVAQNLAVPFTLELAPIPDPVMANVRRLSGEVGIHGGELERLVATVTPSVRARVRLARALALDPLILLAEHPNAALPADDVAGFAADLSRAIATRRIASVTLTADRTFAEAIAEHVLTLQPATGELKARAGWRSWLGR